MKHAILWLALSLAPLGAVAVGVAPPADGGEALKASLDATKPVDREKMPGAAIYHGVCETCHAGQAPKAPAKTFIEMLTPESIHRALSVGIMKAQAANLSEADKRNVAEYLSGVPFGAPKAPEAPNCSGAAAKFDLSKEPAVVGWGVTEGSSHFVSGDVAKLSAADVPRLKLKWAFAYPSSMRARSAPTFAYGALYVGSQDGTVYALDAKSGCVRFRFQTSAEVRTAVVIPPRTGAHLKQPPVAYFGDIIGRVHAINALTGKQLWQTRVDDHPSATVTGSPVYHDGTVYVAVSSLEEAIIDPHYNCCTFRGSVVALDAATGKQKWKHYTIPETPRETGTRASGAKIMAPSGASVWNTPTIDAKRGLIYFGTGNNYTGPANEFSNSVIALELKTGKVAWHWQIVGGDAWNVGCMVGLDTCPPNPGPDYDVGSGTMLVKLADGSERILVGLKSGTALAIDPEKHDASLWSNRVGRGSIQGGIQFGMAYDGERLYVPIADMADSGDASSKARDAAAGPARPGLYAIDPANGKLLWSTPTDGSCAGRPFCDLGILASISAIPGAVFAGHMDGRVRAYDSATGKVLWQFDTSEEQTALGGAKARGGSIGGGGPIVHDGMLYTNSGYGLYLHMPGNMLAAFSVDGR